MFFVFETIALEPVRVISLIDDENTCDRQSTCYQRVLRFWILLREMFPNSICSRLMEKWDKSVAVEVPAVFRTREHENSYDGQSRCYQTVLRFWI